jgi:hypothetical protein
MTECDSLLVEKTGFSSSSMMVFGFGFFIYVMTVTIVLLVVLLKRCKEKVAADASNQHQQQKSSSSSSSSNSGSMGRMAERIEQLQTQGVDKGNDRASRRRSRKIVPIASPEELHI